MQIRQFVLAAFSLTALAAVPASANPREACKADVQRFCKDVEPGGGRIIKCLKEHEAELSPECKAAGEAMKAKKAEFDAACGGDAYKYCKDVPQHPKSIGICLKSNQDRITKSCSEFIEKNKPPKGEGHHGKGRRHHGAQQ